MANQTHEKVQVLLAKADSIKEGYAEGKAKAIEERDTLKEEHAAKAEQVKETHKMYILDQVTVEAYNTEKSNLEELTEKVKEAEQKVSLIDSYMQEDLKGVVQDIKALEPDYRKEQYEANDQFYQKAQELKKQYLQAIREEAQKCRSIHTPMYHAGELEVQAGLKKMNYSSGNGDFGSTLMSDGYGGKKPATVSRQEIENAFYNR